jgi:hypothetical protein
MRPLIELVYFSGCPHTDAARAALRMALEGVGLPAEWQEWDQARSETPARLQRHASPTVLIGGKDVTGAEPLNAGRACRADGIPSLQMIALALQDWRRL